MRSNYLSFKVSILLSHKQTFVSLLLITFVLCFLYSYCFVISLTLLTHGLNTGFTPFDPENDIHGLVYRTWTCVMNSTRRADIANPQGLYSLSDNIWKGLRKEIAVNITYVICGLEALLIRTSCHIMNLDIATSLNIMEGVFQFGERNVQFTILHDLSRLTSAEVSSLCLIQMASCISYQRIHLYYIALNIEITPMS